MASFRVAVKPKNGRVSPVAQENVAPDSETVARQQDMREDAYVS